MTTENVLVSRAWVNAMEDYVLADLAENDLCAKIMDMPHFIESERDAASLGKLLLEYISLAANSDGKERIIAYSAAQAAINALRRKDGE